MRVHFALFLLLLFSCQSGEQQHPPTDDLRQGEVLNHQPYILILGTAQDGGSPHIACKKSCCSALFNSDATPRMVASLGLVSPADQRCWMFDATPDFTQQVAMLSSEVEGKKVPDGIFLTHAHIGHYTGLMYLGREALGAEALPVFVMPRMHGFLTNNGPWSQLIALNNIALQPLENGTEVVLSDQLKVTPFTVPHRDEFSETVGFFISGPEKTAVFIPDIDKWEKWSESIEQTVKRVDYAFIDATFYNQEEIPHRDMAEIPHPFVVETMDQLKNLSDADRKKVYFIHLNHSNPLLDVDSEATQKVTMMGFNIARKAMRFDL